MYVYILGQPLLGNTCPNMSISPFQQCVKGFYCPDPSTVIQCPENYYCKVWASVGGVWMCCTRRTSTDAVQVWYKWPGETTAFHCT